MRRFLKITMKECIENMCSFSVATIKSRSYDWAETHRAICRGERLLARLFSPKGGADAGFCLLYEMNL